MSDPEPIPGSEDEAILDLLHGLARVPTAAALVDAIQELGALRLDWAQQVHTIEALQASALAQQVRIDRLVAAIAQLSRALADAHVAPPLAPPAAR